MNAQQISEMLAELSKGIDPPYPCWLGGGDADQGPSYCRDCAQKKVNSGEAEFVDGGWSQDSDTCVHCEDCGKLLDYALTEYGVAYELEHFQSSQPAVPMSAEDAYHLARLFDGAPDDPAVIAVVTSILQAQEPRP